MAACTRPVPAPRSKAPESVEILRFRISERQLHWAIAVPFMVSYTTAAILVAVYNPHPALPFRAVFSWIHRISGVCLTVGPSLVFLRHRGELHVYRHNVREAWLWRLDDVKWLFLMGPSTLNSKIELPHQGKFNAAEKINFMVLTSTYPLYVFTGVLIWLPGVAIVAWLLHFSMALIATPLILGHIFMATINPDTRVGLTGMLSGLVDRQWARHHYRRWYDENFGRAAVVQVAAETLSPVHVEAAVVSAPAGAVSHATGLSLHETEPDAASPAAPATGAGLRARRVREPEEREEPLAPCPAHAAARRPRELATWPAIAGVAPRRQSVADTT